jgi:hypothetical protein
MEPQGRGNVPALHTPERNKRLGLRKTTLEIESARSNSWAECRTKYRHRAEGEVFLLTFPLIGLFRFARNQDLRTADRSVTASAMQVWYASDGRSKNNNFTLAKLRRMFRDANWQSDQVRHCWSPSRALSSGISLIELQNSSIRRHRRET